MVDCVIQGEPMQAEGPMRPRLLPCGHSVSEAGLLLLLKQPAGQLRCPIDRKPLPSRNIADYKVNYALCEVLDASASGGRISGSPEPPPLIHRSKHEVVGSCIPPVDTPLPPLSQSTSLGELSSSLPSNGYDNATAPDPVVSAATEAMCMLVSLQALLLPPVTNPEIISTSDYLTLHVTSLDLSRAALRPVGVSRLVSSLPSVLSLKTLNLHKCNILTEGAVSLAPSIACLKDLQCLDLGKNNIGSAGLEALAPTLEGLTYLTSLDLSGNVLGSMGAVHLSESLLHLVRLRSLNLMNNGFADAGIIALAKPLGKLKNLQLLNLGSNRLTEKGMCKFAPRVRRMTALRKLTLSHNSIGNEGALTLVPHLEDLDHIKAVYLIGSDVTDEGLHSMLQFCVEENLFHIY